MQRENLGMAREATGSWASSLLCTAAPALLVCVGYYVGANIGFIPRFPPATPSVMWPPNAILTATLLLTPPRWWWIYLLAALPAHLDRKSTRLNSSHLVISYAVFCLKKKKKLYSRWMTHHICV